MTMQVFTSSKKIQNKLFEIIQNKKTIGFVPTMGFLHEGHLELIRSAKSKCDIVVVSIFVNKKQFGLNEDFNNYPTDLTNDIKKLENEKVDFLFRPTHTEMYPEPFLTSIEVTKLTNYLCGASRPGHFEGVAVVVSKLINIVMPDFIFFGQKDYQQCAVLKQMITDLNYRTKMVVCPIIREKSGLALSSRNAYLTAKEKQNASMIFKTLNMIKDRIDYGSCTKAELITIFEAQMSKINAKIDYIEFSNISSLQPLDLINKPLLIATAVFIGKTRLIDNIIVE